MNIVRNHNSKYIWLNPLQTRYSSTKKSVKSEVVAMVFIEGRHYFTVNKYSQNSQNNKYSHKEIGIYDYNGDVYYQKDMASLESVKNILCLPPSKYSRYSRYREYSGYNPHVTSLISFNHYSIPKEDFFHMSWSEIYEKWGGVIVHMEGVFPTFESDVEYVPFTTATQSLLWD